MTHYSAMLKGVGAYLPEKIWKNQDLTKMMDTSDEWIQERTGIKQRHIAADSETTSDLGFKAAKVALAEAGITSQDIDLILAATLSPDYYFPGIGVLIQHKLGAPCVPAIDIRGQCSGFSWGLATADAFIRSGAYQNILVVGAEIHSRVVEFSNRGRDVSVLFGDAGGAAVVQRQDYANGLQPTAKNDLRGIIDSHMGSDGSGAELLLIRRPGLSEQKRFLVQQDLDEATYLPKMDGKQVFKNAVSRMIESAGILLKRNGLTAQDLDLMIPHQANLRINEMVRLKLGLSEDKVFNNIHKYGNTTAATLPLCMYEAQKEGKLKAGSLILTVAFGSGFTWGANLIRW